MHGTGHRAMGTTRVPPLRRPTVGMVPSCGRCGGISAVADATRWFLQKSRGVYARTGLPCHTSVRCVSLAPIFFGEHTPKGSLFRVHKIILCDVAAGIFDGVQNGLSGSHTVVLVFLTDHLPDLHGGVESPPQRRAHPCPDAVVGDCKFQRLRCADRPCGTDDPRQRVELLGLHVSSQQSKQLEQNGGGSHHRRTMRSRRIPCAGAVRAADQPRGELRIQHVSCQTVWETEPGVAWPYREGDARKKIK